MSISCFESLEEKAKFLEKLNRLYRLRKRELKKSYGLHGEGAIDYFAKELGIHASSARKLLNGKLDVNDDIIQKCEDLFNIPSGCILNSMPPEYTRDGIFQQIRNKFFAHKPINCYKTYRFINDYLKIRSEAWAFLMNYRDLDQIGKKILEHKVFEIETNLGVIMNNLYNISMFNMICTFNNDILMSEFNHVYKRLLERTRVSKDLIFKNNLWGIIKKRLNEMNLDDLATFNLQVKHLPYLNKEDWTMLICYFSLEGKFDKQSEILETSETLLKKYKKQITHI